MHQRISKLSPSSLPIPIPAAFPSHLDEFNLAFSFQPGAFLARSLHLSSLPPHTILHKLPPHPPSHKHSNLIPPRTTTHKQTNFIPQPTYSPKLPSLPMNMHTRFNSLPGWYASSSMHKPSSSLSPVLCQARTPFGSLLSPRAFGMKATLLVFTL